jgi:hypothetical protein
MRAGRRNGGSAGYFIDPNRRVTAGCGHAHIDRIPQLAILVAPQTQSVPSDLMASDL